MITKPRVIKYDAQSGAWTDGERFVKGTLIRKYATDKLGRKSVRGRLSRAEISTYWLDKYGVSADVS